MKKDTSKREYKDWNNILSKKCPKIKCQGKMVLGENALACLKCRMYIRKGRLKNLTKRLTQPEPKAEE